MPRRFLVIPAGLAVLLTLAITSAGCTRGTDEAVEPGLSVPEIRLTRPPLGSRSGPGDAIEFAGEIVVKPGAWAPGVVLLRIMGDQEGRREESSIAAELGVRDSPSGVYEFAGSMEAPKKPARYFVQVIAMRDLQGKRGVDRVATEPIPLDVSR